MREKIENYIENNLKHFELQGVEITEHDIELAEEKVKQGKSVEDACNEVLKGIRECLDDGLDLANSTQFVAYLRGEHNGVGFMEDESSYDSKEEAIAFAKARNWDGVYDGITGEIVWER